MNQKLYLKCIRVVGLMAVFSYTLVILISWGYANYSGYMYFSAGEPVLSIKYFEWILGIIGIFTIPYYIHLEMSTDSFK